MPPACTYDIIGSMPGSRPPVHSCNTQRWRMPVRRAPLVLVLQRADEQAPVRVGQPALRVRVRVMHVDVAAEHRHGGPCGWCTHQSLKNGSTQRVQRQNRPRTAANTWIFCLHQQDLLCHRRSTCTHRHRRAERSMTAKGWRSMRCWHGRVMQVEPTLALRAEH